MEGSQWRSCMYGAAFRCVHRAVACWPQLALSVCPLPGLTEDLAAQLLLAGDVHVAHRACACMHSHVACTRRTGLGCHCHGHIIRVTGSALMANTDPLWRKGVGPAHRRPAGSGA